MRLLLVFCCRALLVGAMAHKSTSYTMEVPPVSFYKRVLPETCTAFSSRKGKQLFASAMNHHGLKCFFHLMEQHTTQVEPAFCGLSTMVIILNAFAVDPKQAWKGPWRWYHEEILNCCLELEQVKQTGITLADFTCLATCQGLSVDVRYASTSRGTLEEFRRAVRLACAEAEEDPTTKQPETEDSVRDLLVVSYNRKILQQTGTGHFSPIAAYDSQSDHVLIMDTARFKYGAHWVPLPLLHQAMLPEDPDTGKSRGFVVLSRNDADTTDVNVEEHHLQQELPVSLLFRYKYNANARQLQANFFDHVHQQTDRVEWDDIYRYWTTNSFTDAEDPNFIFQILEPQYRPLDADTANLVNSVVKLIQRLLPDHFQNIAKKEQDNNNNSNSNNHCGHGKHCRPNQNRTLPLRPEEAIYIVYLSALQPEEARTLVESASDDSEAAQDQLLAAAELLRTVFELAGQRATNESINQ